MRDYFDKCWMATAGLIATGAMALSGCGSDDSSERGFTVRADTAITVATALRKADMLMRINGACRRKWPTIVANFAGFVERPPEGRMSNGHPYVNAVRYSFTAGLDFYVFDAIYNLGAPPGEEERLEKLLGAMQDPVERIQRGLAPIRTPAQLEAHFAAYNRLARAYGLDDCLVAEAHLPRL